MASINVLPPHIASKIAAGEVVQRPASVVKELVDNAIDAKATRVQVEVDEGGKIRIAVSDDGSGMFEEDVRVCIERHATSKISSVDDLDRIHTLGFRGEALASICAVSRFTLISRPKGETLGTKLTVDEKGISVDPAGCPEGTTIEIKDIFYNVPARRKFLKTVQTEYSAVAETVVREALAFEGIHFLLVHNGRKTLDIPSAKNKRERVRQVLGKGIGEHLIPVSGKTASASLEGYVSLPTEHRRNTGLLYPLVNGRYVQDKIIFRALLDPYRTLIPPGRYPVAVLYLDVSPEIVDVNVHPAKTEVRFHQEEMIFHLIRGNVLRALTEFQGQTMLNEEPSEPEPPVAEHGETSQEPLDASSESGRAGSKPSIESPSEPRPESVSPPSRARPAEPLRGQRQSLKGNELDDTIRTAVEAFGQRMAALERGEEPPEGSLPKEPVEEESLWDRQSTQAKPSATPTTPQTIIQEERAFLARMQLAQTYIIGAVEGASDLVIIDQHAAHERIMFEHLKSCRETGQLPSQSLLFPLTWDVAPNEVDIVRENLELLQGLGFELDYFGGETFNVTAIPATMELTDSADLLRDSIEDMTLRIKGKESLQETEISLLQKMACHSSVRAGQTLSREEMESLAKQLSETSNAGTCPHGRPTTLRITEDELKKYFKRTQ